MTIDLIQIADELHGIPDSETKISVPCPVHGDLDATITLTGPEKLEAACADGCEPKVLWRGLVKESETLARLWAEKSKEKEEKANAGASGPGADGKHDNEKSGFSQQPPRPETQRRKTPDNLEDAAPQDLEIEQSLLGALFISAAEDRQRERLYEAAAKLTPEDFYRPSHALIYQAMLRVDEQGGKIDVYTIREEMGADLLEQCGGVGYLAQLAAIVPISGNAAYYASLIHQKARERKLWSLSVGLGQAVTHGGDVPALIERINQVGLNGNGPAQPEALPQVFIRRKIEVLTLDKLRARRQAHVQKWIVDPWLARGELSIWSGKVEHGKTSVLRELTMCALRGERFLDRPTERCRVFYAMLDADGEDLTYDEFEKMGINEYDTPNIMFMFEPMLAAMENGPEQFFRALWDWRPDLVIIDPVARLQQVADFLDYKNTYLMAMLSQYAKTLDAHFCLPMHIPRGRPAGASVATAAFGSVAWGASANARFVVERKEPSDVHVIRTSKGKSAGFQGLENEHVLEMNQYTHRITLGKPLSFGDRARGYKMAVLDFLRGAPCEEFTGDALAHQLNEMRAVVQAAANMLAEDQENYDKKREHGNPTGVRRSGKGKRGSPFIYRYEPRREDDVEASEHEPARPQEDMF